MAKDRLSRKLAVILHADVVDSTSLVQKNETLAHERIQSAFRKFSETIISYGGVTRELRGDALVAEFDRASDAVSAAFAFQADHTYLISRLKDDLRPTVRVGIAMGEVVIADNTVTGSGVVLAQRVEQLADHGGLCITAALHEALPKRMPFDLENLGEQVLKGFDDPVQVYRVELSAGQLIPAPEQDNQRGESPKNSNLILATIVIALVVSGGAAYWFKTQKPKVEAASIERIAIPLPDKPSIAVLPFTNISDDPKQEYFVDGMTEDLITDLSKLSGMFVIARNSVFTYKNKAVNIQQVAVDLGVRYVLEGSVRRVGGQIRINAQLIDANTGGHLWAERYDGKLDDIFTLQDKITRKIVTALSVKLTPGEEKQRIVKYTENARAYDEFLKGWNLGGFDSPEEFNIKVKHFKKAIELDPTYGHAHAALANIYRHIRENERLKAVGVDRNEAILLAFQHNEEAMKYPTPLAHRVNSDLLSKAGKWDEAMAEAGLAIDLNPNDWIGYRAMTGLLINSGRPIEAKIYLNEAIRLNPRENYSWHLASILFHLEQYEEAIEILLAEIDTNPDDEWYYLLLAASYGHLERGIEGKVAIQEFDDLRKEKGIDYSYGTSELTFWNFRDEATRERIREGLRKAGMMWSIGY